MKNDCVLYVLAMSVLLFCILAIFVYLCDFAAIDCFNVALMLQDFNKHIHNRLFILNSISKIFRVYILKRLCGGYVWPNDK